MTKQEVFEALRELSGRVSDMVDDDPIQPSDMLEVDRCIATAKYAAYTVYRKEQA